MSGGDIDDQERLQILTNFGYNLLEIAFDRDHRRCMWRWPTSSPSARTSGPATSSRVSYGNVSECFGT